MYAKDVKKTENDDNGIRKAKNEPTQQQKN